jgi:hypothetical protein
MIDLCVEACMARVIVTPVIGTVSRDRLGSMTGTHALHERAVVRSFQNRSEIGPAIEDALHEIAVSEAGARKRWSIDEMSYLVKFKLD